MRKRLIKILLVLIIAIFSVQLKVQAAVITSTDKQVQSNSGSVTISVTSKQSLGSFKLKLIDNAGLTLENTTKGSSSFEVSGDKLTITGSSSDGITSLGSFTFKVPTVTTDTTYRIKFSISGMETTNLDPVADETNTAVLTVKAPVVETPKDPEPEPETPSTTTPEPKPEPTPEPQKKSSEARLKNLGIKPNDFSGFKKDKTEYSVEVPNDVASVEVYAEPLDSKAKVSGHGTVSLNEGNNKIGVKVTAEDGTTKTYILNIKRKTAEEVNAENGENRLKSLSIKPEEYDFSGFDSEKTEYTAEVPNEVEQIEVAATAMDSNAQITGTGMIDLEEGENELKIEVIAVSGEKKTYTLTVTRKEAEKTELFGLSTLTINGLKLTPSFKVGTYEYTVELIEDLTSLEIKAKANTEDATVEIVGNENLQEGENIITILVKNEETEENATYQIIVNKNLPVVEIVEKTSWLKPSTWGKEEKIKFAIIIVLIILIICAIILKIRISKGNPKAMKVDLPGADELDKAIAEHQELVGEDNFVEEMDIAEMKGAVDTNEIQQNYLEEIAKNRLGDFEDSTEDRPKRRGRHF